MEVLVHINWTSVHFLFNEVYFTMHLPYQEQDTQTTAKKSRVLHK